MDYYLNLIKEKENIADNMISKYLSNLDKFSEKVQSKIYYKIIIFTNKLNNSDFIEVNKFMMDINWVNVILETTILHTKAI